MTDQQNPLDGIVTDPTDIGEEMQDEIAELGDAAIGALQEALLETSPEEKRILMRRVGALQERLADAEEGLQELAPAPRRSKIAIAGIERTQATQYFLFNGQGSGFAADNTVPLVANKSMILRVYVNRSRPPQFNVTGRVSYAGHPDLSPINGPIPARASSTIDRGSAADTLNFRVPAAHCTGSVAFTIRVFDPTRPNAPRFSASPQTFTATFDPVPQVRVHGVLIHYTGRGLNIPAPSSLDLSNTLAWVGRVYPISGFNYTGFTVINFNGDLTVGGGGGCGTGWNQLFNILWNMRSASGTNDVYVGLLPPGVPTSGVIGCGGGGVAIGYVGDGPTMAQEIGHAFGRAHAPCGNPGGVDPNYPTYDAYPSGSIGEFGFDNDTSQVYNPASTFDFMSYCGPVWTSPYTYIGLKNAITASPAAAHPDRPQVRDVEREYLYLNFRVHKDGRAELLPSFHLYGPAPVSETGPLPVSEIGPLSSVSCDLLDEKEQIIVSHHCHLRDPHQDPEGPYLDFHEVVPWEPEVRSIVFRRLGEEIQIVEVEEETPEVDIQASQVDEREEQLRIEWEGRYPEKDVTYLLRYSHDDGNTWRAVAADLTETRYDANLNLLPGGERCMFQVVASAGIQTATAETEPFSVARKPRQPHILSPESGATFVEGEPVMLLGGGFSPDFETPGFEDLVWTSNIEGVIGVGYELTTNTLSVGRHRITLSLPDGLGGEASAGVFVKVKPRE